MPATIRHSAARLALGFLLVMLVGGCAGHSATSTAASPSGTTSTTAAPSTTAPATTVPPTMTAEELVWLNAISKLHTTIDKPFNVGNLNMTRAKMVELGNAFRTCSRELARIGAPSDRLQPVYVIVQEACRIYDKGAKCFATAARVSDASGAVVAGSPEERTQKQAMDCGFAAQGDGGNRLADAEAKGQEIKAAVG